MSSRRIFAGLGVGLVAALAPAATAQADPVVLPPPTADVRQTTLIRLEGFPANSTVQVQVAPHDDVAAREITVSHVPVDGRGSGAVQFTWPATYQHCDQDGIHVTCKRHAWATPSIADVSAGAVNDPGEANIASLRLLAAGTPAPDVRLAQRFRPLLEFDSSERWRPLEIQRLFADSTPLVCLQKGRGCLVASSPTTLDVPTVPPHAIPRQPEFLDWPGFQSDPNSYRSPHRECVANGVLDCNSGPRSAIYAHAVRGPGGGYTYLDYWWFYRFNHAPFQQFVYDEHEGDWEGAEVAVSGADPQQFDFVGFAAHTAVWRYLHAVLTCDNPVTHQDSGCGSVAKRPRVYVANGTHASYPVPCRRLVKFIFVIHYCWQTGKPLPENGFDGKRSWGNNFDANALQAFGVPWVDYPLNWNSAPKPTVKSPGNQGRYQHPWETSCTLVPAVVPIACLSAAQRGECESWNGPFTAATACDPTELDQALRSGTLGRPGSFSLSLDGSRTGSAPGLAQAVGGALTAGQTVRLSGRAPAATQLLLQAQDRNSVLSVRYTSLHLTAGGTVTVRAVRAGGRVVLRATSPTGARLRPAQSVRESLRPPRRPRRVHAHRRGRRIRVTFVSRSANASVQLRRTRRGAALTTRLVHLRHGSRQPVTLTTIRRARFVTVTALSRTGIPSRPVTVRIR